MKSTAWLVLIFVALLCPAWAWGGEFRVGAAEADITPPNGMPLSGYYAFRPSSGVADPIHIKAIVVEQDGEVAAMVALDLGTISRGMVAEARQAIQERCGIAGDRVMISATHTHTAPALPRGTFIDQVNKANTPESKAYAAKLPGLVAVAVAEAKAKLAPATAWAASGRCEGISFNRRVLRQGEAKAIWQPQQLDPKRDTPAGPVDPELGLMVFRAANQEAQPLAAYLNFAMHPTSMGGTRISADYPGAFRRLVCERHGPGMVALFANGCCGDINHTDYVDHHHRSTAELGMRLADAADEAWPNLRSLTTCPPRVKSEMVTLKRRTYTAAQVAKAHDIAKRMLKEKFSTAVMAEAVSILDSDARKDEPLVVEVQAITFAREIVVVSMPGEMFVELGLELKKKSPFAQTIIAELANGSIGYIPTRRAYPQGNYEVVSARAEEGTGEKLVEVGLKLLGELKQ